MTPQTPHAARPRRAALLCSRSATSSGSATREATRDEEAVRQEVFDVIASARNKAQRPAAAASTAKDEVRHLIYRSQSRRCVSANAHVCFVPPSSGSIGRVTPAIISKPCCKPLDGAQSGPLADFARKCKAAFRIFFPPRPKSLTPKEEGRNRLRMILVADRCAMNANSLVEMKTSIVNAVANYVEVRTVAHALKFAELNCYHVQ